MTEWKPRQGRITLFPALLSGKSASSALDLYRSIWGSDPDSFQKQPVPAGVASTSSAQGIKSELGLNCNVTPNRIDLALSPVMREDDPAPLAVIENVAAFKSELEKLIKALPGHHTGVPIARVALSMHFSKLASSFADANRLIATVLPDTYRLTLAEEHDFVLQINDFMPPGAGTPAMNFINRWSSERVQMLTMTVDAGGVPQATENLVSEAYAASVLFDYNNVPSKTPLGDLDQTNILRQALDRVSLDQTRFNMALKGF